MHEVLHTAHIMASMFDDFIVRHAATQADSEVKAAADKISESLGDFYQLCGQRFADAQLEGGWRNGSG
jgi:hypothetical protein